MLPIPDVENTMTRPITTSVIEQLKRLTGIELSMELLNPGEGGAIPQQNSVIQTTGYDRELTGLATSSRSLISVSVEDNIITDHVLATPILKSDAEYIFHDKPLDIVMIPTYALSKLVIAMELRFPSRKAAKKWMDHLNAKISMGYESVQHRLTYSYMIPSEFMYLLLQIHEKREAVEGYGDTIQEWLKESFTKRMRVVTNQAGKQASFVIAEDQINAVGKFDTEVITQPNSANERGAFTFSLNYEVLYKRPTNVIVQYPELIHNQVLPKPFDGDGLTESFDFSSIDLWGEAFSVLGLKLNSLFMPKPWQNFGMMEPWYDRWVPNQRFPLTKPMLTFLCQFSPTDLTDIVNLHQLGKYSFDDDIMAYLEEAGDDLLKIGRAPFKITLFRNDIPKSDHWLTLDTDLMVRVFEEVDLRQIYRLQIGLYCGLASLPESSKQTLIKHGRAVHKIMLAICPNMTAHGLPPIGEDGGIAMQDYMTAAKIVEACAERREMGSDSAWTLVGIFSIITERQRRVQ